MGEVVSFIEKGFFRCGRDTTGSEPEPQPHRHCIGLSSDCPTVKHKISLADASYWPKTEK